MWDDVEVSKRLAIDEWKEGEGITPRLPFHDLILFIPSQTRKLHFLDNIIFSLSNELDEEYKLS